MAGRLAAPGSPDRDRRGGAGAAAPARGRPGPPPQDRRTEAGGRTRVAGPRRWRARPAQGVFRPIRAGRTGSVVSMDVTDETFQEEVLTRSMTVPVVLDLCAP